MSIATRFPKSWAVAGFDIKDPSLILYLPLWSPYSDMAGSTIYSYDRNRLSFTVTGATWGSEGRTFDGADDLLKYVVANWRSGDTTGTVACWFKTSSAAQGVILGTGDTGGSGKMAQFGIRATGELFLNINGSVDNDGVKGSTLVNDDKWHLGFILTTGSAWELYVADGAAESLTVLVGSNSGTWLNAAAGRDNVTVGMVETDTQSGFFNGTIGEVAYWGNKPLSAGERAYYYQVTKWRYE